MIRKSLRSRILADAALTAIAGVLVLGLFFLFYRMLADRYGPLGVGLYALVRRGIALAIPLLTLGFTEALPRFLPQLVSLRSQLQVFALSTCIVLTLLFVAGFVLLIDPLWTSTLLFGVETYEELVLPFFCFLTGLVAHALAYSFLRGNLRTRALNVLQLFNLGILPILVLWATPNSDLASILMILGAGTSVTSIAALWLSLSLFRGNQQVAHPVRSIVLVKFALSRLPALLTGAALVSILPFLARGHVSTVELGYISLSLALLVGLAGSVLPLGIVLLPHLSRVIGIDGIASVRDRLHPLTAAIIQVFAFATCQIVVFADLFVSIWVGERFLDSVTIVRTVMASLVFLAFYNGLKGVLDAVSFRPYNSMNTGFGLLILVLGSLTLPLFVPNRYLAFSYAAWFTVCCGSLAALTYLSLLKVLQIRSGPDRGAFWWALILNAGGVALSVLLRSVCDASILSASLYLAALFALYGLVLHKVRFVWPTLFLSALDRNHEK